jgi:hypothetical protein
VSRERSRTAELFTSAAGRGVGGEGNTGRLGCHVEWGLWYSCGVAFGADLLALGLGVALTVFSPVTLAVALGAAFAVAFGVTLVDAAAVVTVVTVVVTV